jgi:acyl-CoA thioester hydrolase
MKHVDMEFSWPVRVYYEDTDSGGVVYHSNYLNFMERARTEWLRSVKLEQDEMINELGVIFVVRSIAVDYLKPAVFNDALLVKTTIERLAKASITFNQEIVREKDGQLLTRGTVKVASVSLEKSRPVAIPDVVLDRLNNNNE